MNDATRHASAFDARSSVLTAAPAFSVETLSDTMRMQLKCGVLAAVLALTPMPRPAFAQAVDALADAQSGALSVVSTRTPATVVPRTVSASAMPGMSAHSATSDLDGGISGGGGVDGDNLGADTRKVLALQVSGRAAAPGPAQAIPGDEATVEYKRYLDSFSHAVPEYFEQTVKSNSGS